MSPPAPGKKIRCLIVDDSPAFRSVLKDILSVAPDVDVVGEAGDGDEAVARARELKPDVITLDVQMPRRNGLDAIRAILTSLPNAAIVVVCAGASDESLGIGFRALSLGALDVLEKPQAGDPARYARQVRALFDAIRAAGAEVRRAAPISAKQSSSRRKWSPAAGRKISAVGLVGSTGGPAALKHLLGALPADYPIPILVVQHISEGFAPGLVKWLSESCKLRVKLAEHGEPVAPRTVFFAPDANHLLVSMGRVRLDGSAPVQGFRPSGNVLLTSLAREFGASALGVILTGMGTDGSSGLQVLRREGGHTLAQGPESSVIFGMPRVALDIGAAEAMIELADLPGALQAAGETQRPANKREKKTLLLVDDTETVLALEQKIFSDTYSLRLARNGQEAVLSAVRERPHGILMDYSMPVMNGAEALKTLRQSPTTRDIPVIMVTSERDPAVLRRCEENGCQAVVPKPINPQVLTEMVRRFMPP